MNHLIFEAVDHHLKDICNNQNAFGGNLVLLRGDFRYFPSLHKGITNLSLWPRSTEQHFRMNVVFCTCV